MTDQEWDERFMKELRSLGPPNEEAVTRCVERARKDRHGPTFVDYTPEKMAGFQAFQDEIVEGLFGYIKSTPDYNTSLHDQTRRLVADQS
jgi:hypothetical protein